MSRLDDRFESRRWPIKPERNGRKSEPSNNDSAMIFLAVCCVLVVSLVTIVNVFE